MLGLGNPGLQYAATRHNVGFWCIDQISSRFGIPLKKPFLKRFQIGRGFINNQPVTLIKPMTFMNNSGTIIKDINRYLKFSSKDLLVICDNLDLSPGMCRLKDKGSAAGHNGLKSIINNINQNDFMRLFIGIGRPHQSADVVKYVLSPPKKIEKKIINETIDLIVDYIPMFLTKPIQEIMNVLNRRRI